MTEISHFFGLDIKHAFLISSIGAYNDFTNDFTTGNIC